MKTYFVTRHSGAVEWAKLKGFPDVELINHLDPGILGKGDIVMGTLPIHLAAEVCARGATFYALTMDVLEGERGQQLSLDDMLRRNARLEQFHLARVND